MVRLVPFAVLVIFLLLAASCQHQGRNWRGEGYASDRKRLNRS